jgi:hypothetical protein
MTNNVNEYFKAVSAYEMSLRFKGVNSDEAASYRQMAREFIYRYIDDCYLITRDRYLNVYKNVRDDAKANLNKSAS